MGVPHPVRLAVAAAVLLFTGAARAAELWNWHAFDVTLLKKRSAEWSLHTRLRIREGELQQSRAGTILRLTLHPRVTTIGGYYYGREEDTREEWQNSHRLFGGAEAPVFAKGGVRVNARGMVERFFPASRPDFTRFRQRIRLSTARTFGPVASGEWFWDTKGYLAGRYSGGLRWRKTSWATIEFGYMYDARRATLGAPRHGVVTQLLLRQGGGDRRERQAAEVNQDNH